MLKKKGIIKFVFVLFIGSVLLVHIAIIVVDGISLGWGFVDWLKLKQYTYGLVKHLFGSKEVMWIALTGIDTAIGITTPLVWGMLKEYEDRQNLIKKLVSSLEVEMKNNLEIVMNEDVFGLETQTKSVIYNKVLTSIDLVKNTKQFEKIERLYSYNHHYNEIIEHKLSDNMYLQLSISKTDLMLKYLNAFLGFGNHSNSTIGKDIKIWILNYKLIKNYSDRELRKLYWDFINDPQFGLSKFLEQVKNKVEIVVNKCVMPIGLKKIIKTDISYCFIFDENKQNKYNIELENYGANAAANNVSSLGAGKQIFNRFHRQLKTNLYPYELIIQLVATVKRRVAEEYRIKLTKIYNDLDKTAGSGNIEGLIKQAF